MGNVLFLTDTAGNKAAEYLLDSYGNIAYSQGASVNSYLWRTKEYDNPIGKYIEKGNIIKTDSNNSDIGKYKWYSRLGNYMNINCSECLAHQQLEQLNNRKTRIIDLITQLDTAAKDTTKIIRESIAATYIEKYYNDEDGYGNVVTIWWTLFGDNCSCINRGYYVHERQHYYQINSNGSSWWREKTSDPIDNPKEVEKPAYEVELMEIKYWIKKGESYK
jgi:hypothetical protein